VLFPFLVRGQWLVSSNCGRNIVVNHVSDCAITLQPAFVHSLQHRDPVVHIVIDLYYPFVVMKTVESPHVLLQRSLP